MLKYHQVILLKSYTMGLNNARKYKTHRKPNDILTFGMLGAAEQKNLKVICIKSEKYIFLI